MRWTPTKPVAPCLSPGFSKHLPQIQPNALCRGCAAGNHCVCSEAGAQWCSQGSAGPRACPGVALLLSIPCSMLPRFCQGKGESCSEAAAAPGHTGWGLKSCRQGGQWVPTMLPCKQLQPPDSPKNPSGRSRPKPAPGGREGEAELCPLGARGQIPIQGSEVANPPHLLHYNSSFLLSVTCWCRVLNFSIS